MKSAARIGFVRIIPSRYGLTKVTTALASNASAAREENLTHPKFLIAALAVLLVGPAMAQVSEPDLDDIPAKLVKSTANYDYEKRVAMIPMRDGVKVYTVMIIPKG